MAGTTRDFIEEQLHLGGTAIRLIDTAGLRDTADRVESIGIELRDALDALGQISGTVDTDDILEWIFSEFCVGK